MTSRKGKRNRSKSARPKPGHGLRVLIGALFVSGFLVAVLVALAIFRHSVDSGPKSDFAPPPPVVSETPGKKSRPAAPEVPESLALEVESALWRAGVAARVLRIDRNGDAPSYLLEGALPSPQILETVRRQMSAALPGTAIKVIPDRGELLILWHGTPRATFVFQPVLRPSVPAATPPRSPAPAVEAAPGVLPAPRVAIIMDDLGRDLAAARALLAIDLPVTFAILPGEAYAGRIAELAHQGGREILIHIPMEPLGYPAADPGNDALLTSQSAEEIRHRFRGFVERVPFAVGGNNHMGSRFTQDREGMRVVLDELKASGFFFVDSLTSGRSVARQEALDADVPALARDRFLDNVQEVERIAAEIRGLIEVARRQGGAIGICHPYPQTLAALRQEERRLRHAGVEFVPVSALLPARGSR